MAGFDESSLCGKTAKILAGVAFLFHLIGFAAPYWRKAEYHGYTENSGLWKTCQSGHIPYFGEASGCINHTHTTGWFEATQAFETLGFIAALAALVLIVLYIFVPQTSGKKIICILSMLACFAAAACIMLGIIIYGSKVERNLSWSFALCCIAGIIFGVSGVLLLIDMLKK